MRNIGRLLGGDFFTVKAIVDEIYTLEKELAMVGYVAILMSKLVTKAGHLERYSGELRNGSLEICKGVV